MWCHRNTVHAWSCMPTCLTITLPQATSEVNRSSCGIAGLTDDLWHTGYKLNEDMRPTFISRPMACTILRAGKSINFLRSVHALLVTCLYCMFPAMLQAVQLSACIAHHLPVLYVPCHATGCAAGFSRYIHKCRSAAAVSVSCTFSTLPCTASCKLACAFQRGGWQACRPHHAVC